MMKKNVLVTVLLFFACSLFAKQITGTFIFYNVCITFPGSYPVYMNGFLKEDSLLGIRIANQGKLVKDLLRKTCICPYLLGVESSSYCSFFQQKFGKEQGMSIYLRELLEFSKESDNFYQCKLVTKDKRTIHIELCGITGSFEMARRNNVAYDNTLGVDLSAYKTKSMDVMFPIKISTYHPIKCLPVIHKGKVGFINYVK